MEEDKIKSNNTKGPWWKQGVELFSEVSTWIAGPIILALIAGKALDAHYGTKPLWLLVFASVSFLVSAYGIFRTVKRYTDKIKKEIEKSKNNL
ncbi:MAG: AtpZ/AtpI family protein [Candidatus Paceibacterota bacterium]